VSSCQGLDSLIVDIKTCRLIFSETWHYIDHLVTKSTMSIGFNHLLALDNLRNVLPLVQLSSFTFQYLFICLTLTCARDVICKIIFFSWFFSQLFICTNALPVGASGSFIFILILCTIHLCLLSLQVTGLLCSHCLKLPLSKVAANITHIAFNTRKFS